MTERPGPGTGPFAAIDPKLTVFALANGMDLSKGEDYRRLEWFTEGLERGILIRVANDGAYDLTALAWKTGKAEQSIEAAGAGGLAPQALSQALTDAIEIANGLSTPA